MHDTFWARLRLCNRLSPLISVPIPLVMPGQAVANCCNAGVCCAPGDLSIPYVLNRRHIRGFGLSRQFTPFSLRKSTATGTRCGRALSSWNSKFPPMRRANGTPLDVTFDQRNFGWLSYLIQSLIPSFGRT